MSAPKPITILHLSDTQFGRNHRFGRMGASAPDGDFDTLVRRLQQDLEHLRDKHELVPDLLAVTGDLAEWGEKAEFDDVFLFLDQIAEFLRLRRDRVLVVPGNHDINHKACESYFANCEADGKQPQQPFWPKFRHYAHFFERFYEGWTDIRFTEAEPWTLFEIRDLRVVVAGLNSAMTESHLDKDHYGWVGEDQLRWFAGRLRTYKKRGWMRIGLLHHNVLRKPMEDEENLRDADLLTRLLGGELNLLLHGHTHEGGLKWLGPRLPVLSTGSASVALEARPQEVPNQYQVIRLYPDRIWHGTRQYVPDRKGWIGDPRSSPDGELWHHKEEVRFEHVGKTFGQRGPAEVERTDHLATVVASYRSHVATTLRHQMLHDLCTRAEDQDIPGGLALLDIFIPQAVHPSLPPKDLPRGVKPDGDWKEDPFGSWGEGTPSMSVEAALLDSKQPWIFLLGAPGAGKTSLTRWFCLKLCVPRESLPQLSSDLVPVRVEMPRFDERYRSAKANSRTYDFFDYLDQEHTEQALALRGESLRELGDNGRLVWLFDGMDEVPEVHDREWYAKMIVGLQRARSARGVITSRIVGAQPILPYFRSAEMGIYTLLEFDEARIREFIARWHEEAFRGAPEAGASRRERLERVIAESRPVRDLCKNPLLLTLIALLNRGGDLPRRRHLLYRRAVELMAAQWEANKRLPSKEEILHEPEERIEFLRELAWWMHFELPNGSRNLVREEDLLHFTSRFLAKRYGGSLEQARRYADALIGHLRERNYILARIGERLFGFVHKTFLEYLVAEAIRSRFTGRAIELGWLENLFQKNWESDAWREILTLICGMLDEDRPENVMNVLQAVLADVDIYSHRALGFSAFAVHCLAEVRQLDQEPIRTFMLRLAEFAQHEISGTKPSLSHDFINSLHLIGPRWPERERWSQWALGGGWSNPEVRVAAYKSVLAMTPVEQHESLVLQLLKAEHDSFVARETLKRAHLSEERIHTLLTGKEKHDEDLQCIIACGIARKGFRFSRFPNEFLTAALQTLKKLLTNSRDTSIKLRAAVSLVEHEPASARDTLVEYLWKATSVDTKVLESIHALVPLIRTDPGLSSELLALQRHFDDWRIHEAVADKLVRAKRYPEAINIILEWIERHPEQTYQERVANRLISWAITRKQVRQSLKEMRTKGSPEARKRLAALVLDRIASQRKEAKIMQMSLDEILDRLETAGEDSEHLAWVIYQHNIPESRKGRVQNQLRRMAAAMAPLGSRLTAAMVMRELSIVPAEEWLAILKDLASSSADEHVRLEAARMLKEEGRPAIESLAASATDETVRAMAAFSLRSLELRAALLKVGRQPVEVAIPQRAS